MTTQIDEYRGPAKYKDAVSKVERILCEAWQHKSPHKRVDIYCWDDSHSLRVAEVSFSDINPETRTGGGFSYMQSDEGSAPVVLFAERAIISTADPSDDALDDAEDIQRLLRAVGMADKVQG